MNPISEDYEGGNKLIAGPCQGEQVPLVSDTYYRGMPLKYEIDGSNSYTGTGNGTITAITAKKGVKAGNWTMTMTAALTADLADPDGNVVAQDIKWADGAAVTIEIAGIKMTLTDGGTAFTATGVHTITIGTGGKYEYTSDLTRCDALYNGAEKTLSSAGYGSVIVSGEVYEGGIVNDSGTVITLTEATRAQLRANGFNPRRVS